MRVANIPGSRPVLAALGCVSEVIGRTDGSSPILGPFFGAVHLARISWPTVIERSQTYENNKILAAMGLRETCGVVPGVYQSICSLQSRPLLGPLSRVCSASGLRKPWQLAATGDAAS